MLDLISSRRCLNLQGEVKLTVKMEATKPIETLLSYNINRRRHNQDHDLREKYAFPRSDMNQLSHWWGDPRSYYARECDRQCEQNSKY
jgi:hypothetical protein